MKRYLSQIYETVKSLIIGLTVTFKYMVRPSEEFTQQYPEVKREPSDGFRGRLYVDIEKCIGCSSCVKACPIDCIFLETIRGADKKLKPLHFDIDMARCMQCGLCVDACPGQNCLFFTKDYEYSRESREELLMRYGLVEQGLWKEETTAKKTTSEQTPSEKPSPERTPEKENHSTRSEDKKEE